MKYILLAFVCCFCLKSLGQTKLISFKSHSGQTANYREAVEGNLFNIGNSNFGLSEISTYEIDTVVNKSGILIVYRKRITM